MAQLDLRAKKGDTYDQVLTFTDNAGNPLDFSGCLVNCEIRKDTPGGKVMQKFCSGAAFNTLLISGNQISFAARLMAEEGTHYYDIQVHYPSGTVKTLVGGKFIVVQDTTA